jgi:acetate kinase
VGVRDINPGSTRLTPRGPHVRGVRGVHGVHGVPQTVATTAVGWGDDATRVDAAAGIRATIEALEAQGVESASVEAVAHRVVHGGSLFREPTLVDDDVVVRLEELSALAPLHNPVAIREIAAARAALPHVPQVAVFDTAFHAALPEVAWRYPVPRHWADDWGVRRYGFHGLSVEWSVQRAGRLVGRRPNTLELVVAHLGSGCSVSAVQRGRSVATSMGMTPLEGLMMGTRAGSIDPGIVLYLLRQRRLELAELDDSLEHRSGLLGVSETTADVRELLEATHGEDVRAKLALEMFVDRAAAWIAAAVTALHRLDALVFTGGIGEHAGTVRAQIVERLGSIGVRPITEDETGVDRVVRRRPGARGGPPVLRIEAREDIVAARYAATVVTSL